MKKEKLNFGSWFPLGGRIAELSRVVLSVLNNGAGAKLLTAEHGYGSALPVLEPRDQGRLYSLPGGSGQKPVIRAGRRRRAEPPAGGRERAEAPRRERESGGGLPPSYTGGGGGTGGGLGGGMTSGLPQIPLGGSKSLLTIVLVVIVICIFGGLQLFGGGDSGETFIEQPPSQLEPTEPFAILPVDVPTRAPRPTATAPSGQVKPPLSGSSGDQNWLVMLYQDADDKVLEQDIYVDLNEAERVGSDERLTIVAQLDRYRAGFQGDGDWVSARRFYVTRDDNLSQVRSQQVADLGEVNMSDGATLVDFVTWAMQTYPADRYALILSDHGMGWPGGWSDAAPAARGDTSIPLASRLGDQIYLYELDDALGEIRARTGVDKIDLLGLDACLMAQLEVFSALEPHARIAVASEEVEPALGWAYTSFLSALKQNPGLSPADVGRLIVESYIDEDQRIVDDQARADLLRQGGGMGGLFGLFNDVSPVALARQMGQDGTISAIDLEALPALRGDFNDFAYTLQNESQAQVARARSYAQSFTSIFGANVPASYIDLGNFTQILRQETRNQDTAQAADRLLASLGQAIVAEKHGPKKPGANGMAIYFPTSEVYRTAEAGARSYTRIANRFSQENLWDDFLAFHYTGKLFTPGDTRAVEPESGAMVRGPGAGAIQLSAVTASSQTAAPGRPVVLSVDVSGQNIGYAYLFVGFYDRASNSIFVADTDYLESPDTRQVGGVYYPDWGSEEFTLEFEWEPVVFAIDDGQQRVTALFQPRDYGKTFEEAIYTVDGIYTYADGGDSRRARLIFSNGALRQVVSFTGDDETGAPREIIPSQGDQFTIMETWMDLNQDGSVAQIAEQQGDTLTFGEQTFQWVELDAAPGPYVVGFILRDLDGNAYQAFTQITVQ